MQTRRILILSIREALGRKDILNGAFNQHPATRHLHLNIYIYIHVPICLHCLPLPTFPTLSWFSEASNTVLQLGNRADRENGFVKVLKTNLITNYTSPSAALLCQNFDRPQYGIERKGLKFNIQISELVSLGKKWLGFKGWQGTRILQFFGKSELAELVQNSWWRVWTNQVAWNIWN